MKLTKQQDEPQPESEEIAALKAKIAELEQHSATQAKELSAAKRHAAGWLIVSPNPLYDDNEKGIYNLAFQNGAAFLAEDTPIPLYFNSDIEVEMHQKGLPEEEIAQAIAKDRADSSKKAIPELTHMGYKCTYFGPDDGQKLEAAIAASGERAAAARAQQDQAHGQVSRDELTNLFGVTRPLRG